MTLVKKCLPIACALALILPLASASSQASGVLLGINSGNSFRTYWITREKGVVRLVAEGPDLIVPRTSGFWRLCLVSGHSVAEGEFSEWDSLVAKPATPSRLPCRASDTTSTDDEQETSRCQSSSWTQLHFVGSKGASLEEHGESNCGAHYSGGTDVILRSIDGTGTINLSTYLSRAERDRLMAATLKSASGEFEDLGTVDTLDVESEVNEVGAHFDIVRKWGVQRAAGYWKATGQATCWPYVACGDGSRTFSIDDFSVPASLVGHNELYPSLATIKAAHPEVRDAVSSPQRDLLVAVTDESLLVFAVDNGRIGAPAMKLAVSGPIVMAEWALGRFVPIWSAQLPRYLRAR